MEEGNRKIPLFNSLDALKKFIEKSKEEKINVLSKMRE